MLPKYPNNLSIIDRADQSHLSTAKGDEIFPICSLSKSFCGVVSTSMAADGEFGKKGLNSTLKEALEHIRTKHLGRWEEINKLMRIVEERKLSDITLSQLLTHSSGLKDDHDIADGKFAGQPIANFIDTFKRGFPTGETHYSNSGFTLMGEIINLASPHQSYRQELQNRVLDKADLQHTKPIDETEEGRSKIGEWRKIFGTKFQGKEVITATAPASSYLVGGMGKVPLAAGALCSSVNDLDKYSRELIKFVAGKPSAFERNPEKCAAIKKMYQVPISLHEELGFRAGAAPGLDILLRGEGENKEVIIGHGGELQTNRTFFSAKCSYKDFIDDEKSFEDDKIKTRSFLQQVEFTTFNYICPKFSDKKSEMLHNLFDAYLTTEEKREIADNYSYEKREQSLQAKQDLLVSDGRLPKDFPQIRAQIEENFYPKFLENCLNAEGVIDEKKVMAAFPTGKEIDAAVNPTLEKAIKESEALLKPLEKVTEKNEETWVEKVGGSKAEKGLVAAMIDRFNNSSSAEATK